METTPYSHRKYVMYLGDDGDRFRKFCELARHVTESLPVMFIKVNCDSDRKRRLDALLTVRKLKLLETVVLLTHVPQQDIDILEEQAMAVIHPGSYDVKFRDGSIMPLDDIDSIYSKMEELVRNGQQQ